MSIAVLTIQQKVCIKRLIIGTGGKKEKHVQPFKREVLESKRLLSYAEQMAWYSCLSGVVQMQFCTAQRFLKEAPCELQSYLQGCSADRKGLLKLHAEGKLYQHSLFCMLLAHYKDIPSTDQLVQQGASPGAWFASGVFYIRPGAWAYAGHGPMLDGYGAAIPGITGSFFPDTESLKWQQC
jgi:hypothetical protein